MQGPLDSKTLSLCRVELRSVSVGDLDHFIRLLIFKNATKLYVVGARIRCEMTGGVRE